MTTANHALTATLIALTIKEPVLVLPLALVSHFVLDMLPHYGLNDNSLSAKQKFDSHLRVELISLIGIVALLFTGAYGWNLALLASIVSILPDIEHPIRYIFYARLGKKPPKTITYTFHKKIQWLERKWGLYVEVGYFIIGYLILSKVVI